MALKAEFQPVQRFEVSTRDEAEAEDFIRQMYVENRVRFHNIRDGARLSATAAQARGIAGDHFCSTIDYSVACDPFDYYLFFTIYNGRLRLTHGREETIVPAGGCSFYPLGAPIGLDLTDLGMRILRLPAARLAAVAEQTAGIGAADLRFEAVAPVSPAMAEHWMALVDLAGSMLLAEDSPVANPVLAEELARTAAVTALHTFPNTAMTVSYQPGPGWAAPVTVRRAAGYIEAHADQPVTLDQVAAAAGVTGRALQYAFRRHYGTTPTGYLRRTRLERAHQELRAAEPGDATVAAVARKWGWASPAHFAATYRQRFGELPSHTLRY
jgi:AraC-like DNA-binding protein